jgi:hypothetical protein
MQCKLEEIEAVWRDALTNQVPPVQVDKPSCQEVVITGDELRRPGGGLSRAFRSRSRRPASTTRLIQRPGIG